MSTRLDERAPSSSRDSPDAVRAIVLPSPAITLISTALGTTIGLVVVLHLVRSHVHQIVGVLVMSAMLTLALVGPQLLVNARSDRVRGIAVACGSLAFGGAIAGLIVSFPY